MKTASRICIVLSAILAAMTLADIPLVYFGLLPDVTSAIIDACAAAAFGVVGWALRPDPA